MPVWGQGITSTTHTFNIAHLTWQQQVQLLASLPMTQFELGIEPISLQTTTRCATVLRYSRGFLNQITIR